jgi:phenylpropionate dioxygenase-like ring-hydroxylating dioxygenase large terminal subunit
MIPNQWYAVLESREVAAGRPKRTRRMGLDLVFWRDGAGAVHALSDVCPHRGAALSGGKVRGDCVQCPFHGFEFDGQGHCRTVPANGRAAPAARQIRASHLVTAEAHGFVFVWWGDQDAVRGAPRFFDDLAGLASATVRDDWSTHYSRAIENQLDVAHLPFVHYNNIGRGGRTLVDGPLVEWQDPDRFRVYVFNRLDDGSAPRRADELARPDVPFWLDFIFPNVWQNHISATTRVVVAFAPVDDEHCVLYLRFYQGFVRVPVLDRLVARLAMPTNKYIVHQDRRVVQTQVPKRPELRGGEKLIQADGPIVAYRVRRQALQEAAGGAP